MLEKISAGEKTQLYRVRTTGSQVPDNYIAIKIIRPQPDTDKKWVKAFIDETKLAALMKHPNIVEIYDFGLMENSFFMAMEYLYGKDLGSILCKSQEKKMPLSPPYALFITSQICSGLDYAHKLTDLQGNPLLINHRAIRPENILITYAGEIKIINFGIARAASQTRNHPSGMDKQNLDSLSPEQVPGKEPDHHSDIFSTGILLWEMVTNKRFDSRHPVKPFDRIQQEEFATLDNTAQGLSVKLQKILKKALAQEVSLRYPSCEEMRLEIEECISLLSERPTPQGLAKYVQGLFPEEMATGRFNAQETAPECAEPVEELDGQLKVVEDILKKAKTTFEEEPVKGKRRTICYGAALAAILVAFAAFWAFGFKEKLLNPSGQEGLAPSFAETAPNPSPLKVLLSKENRNRLEKAGQYGEAQSWLNKATGIIEKNPKEAEACLLKSIAIDPGNAKAYSQLGLAYTALKNPSHAIEAYQKAVQLDSDCPDVYFNLGYLYATQKDYSMAEKMFDQAVKKNPPYLDEALFNLALIQAKQGKRKESIKSLERALQVNPQNKRAQKFFETLKGDS